MIQNTSSGPECAFATTDLALAAYLVLNGKQLLEVERITRDKCAFRFADYPGRHEEVSRFLHRRTSVEPNTFLDYLKSLKGHLPVGGH